MKIRGLKQDGTPFEMDVASCRLYGGTQDTLFMVASECAENTIIFAHFQDADWDEVCSSLGIYKVDIEVHPVRIDTGK